ncbi:MAG TPA: SpoIIE family protein phosphatase [Candidatus Acidoferrum sp.]|nr:SpoIIE family protein phosphatase [Candidatus Acidoferrum sp.]
MPYRMDRHQGKTDLRAQLAAQHGLARRLLAAESLRDAAPAFLAVIGVLLEWDAGGLWAAEGDGRQLRFIQGWQSSTFDATELWEASAELRFAPGAGLPGRALEAGQIVWVDDIERDRELPRRDLMISLGLNGAFAIPIPVGEPSRVRGVAEFFTRSYSPPDERLMALLVGFGDQLAMFINRLEADRIRDHLAAVVADTQDAVITKDLEGTITAWNDGARRLYGYTPNEAIGSHISMLIPPDHEREEEHILARIRRGQRVDTYETERTRKDGVRIDVALTASPLHDPILGIVGASIVARDITAEKRRRQAQEFMVRATGLLDTSLDVGETARTIVQTAVPDLAELCVIDFLTEDGSFGDAVVASVDPSAAAELERIRRDAPLDPLGDHPVAKVLREGRPNVVRDLTTPAIRDELAQSDEHREFITRMRYSSAAVAPLAARGRLLGALSFLHVANDRRYDDSDLALLGDLAARAAMALDNARLYEERDRVAKTLQRGLRPAEPEPIPGLELSVVFEAAGEGVELGGDFYDVIQVGDGWMILIGDVVGRGSEAAALTAQIRHTVRALAMPGLGPRQILERVNAALLVSETDERFATGQLALLRTEPSGGITVELGSAGHPPAVHARRDGSTRLLGGGGLIGMFGSVQPEVHEFSVDVGDTLLLYTDGWLEAGAVEDHRSPEELAAAVVQHHAGSLDSLVHELRGGALERAGMALRDDLVLLALRPTGPRELSPTG